MTNPDPKGTLYIYDYSSKKDLRAIRLFGYPENADFHPLGLDFFRGTEGGLTRLFVVNHQRTGSTIDILDLDYGKAHATFITSVCDGNHNLVSPNAIAPISYTSFYFTNDHRFISRFNPFLNSQETRRVLPLGWATLVDLSHGGPKFKTVARKIPFANGIVLTPTGKEVVIASTGALELRVYDRDPQTNSLTYRDRVPLKFRPDNLNFDESLDVSDESVFDKDGKFLRGLICGGHPSPNGIVAMARDPLHARAPSWVAEVRRGVGRDSAPVSAMPADSTDRFHVHTLYQGKPSMLPPF